MIQRGKEIQKQIPAKEQELKQLESKYSSDKATLKADEGIYQSILLLHDHGVSCYLIITAAAAKESLTVLNNALTQKIQR